MCYVIALHIFPTGRLVVHICTYVCMYIYIHTYLYTCVCIHMYVCTYIYQLWHWLLKSDMWCTYLRMYVCVSNNCHHTITKQQHGVVFVVWTGDRIFPPYCCHNTQLSYTRNPLQARNIICISQSHASRWYKLHVGTCKWYVRMCVII